LIICLFIAAFLVNLGHVTPVEPHVVSPWSCTCLVWYINALDTGQHQGFAKADEQLCTARHLQLECSPARKYEY
jgi:hypothetical protein